MPRSTFRAVITPGSVRPSSDQSDRNRRLHADDDGLRIHDPRKAGDRADHAADKRIDHVERGNIDEPHRAPMSC